jgi:hypothetical protein
LMSAGRLVSFCRSTTNAHVQKIPFNSFQFKIIAAIWRA